MRKEISKRIMSLLLSGAIVSSVSNLEVKAYGNEEYSNYYSDSAYSFYNMKGIYTTNVNGEVIYVYLNNKYSNEYLVKNSALEVARQNYGENFYAHSKSIENPNFIKGVSPLSEKYITVYAFSNKKDVLGWTRIDRNALGVNDYVASTTDLGNFILKRVDLSLYKKNMKGFAKVDLNKDGISNEVVYLGNNKFNKTMSKNEAVNFGIIQYKNYYFQSKKVNYFNKTVTVYAVSDKSYVPGWNKLNKEQVPSSAVVASNTEYMDFLIYIESLTFNNNLVSGSLNKNEALEYAYNNYPNFCILTKDITLPKTNQVITIYTFSNTPYVDGYSIIGNDAIPQNASIFLTLNDAYNFEYNVKNNYSRSLGN